MSRCQVGSLKEERALSDLQAGDMDLANKTATTLKCIIGY